MGTLAGDLCCRGKFEPRGGTPTAWVRSPVTCAVGEKLEPRGETPTAWVHSLATCAVGENLNQGEEHLQHGYTRR